jgi:hypothetical protein
LSLAIDPLDGGAFFVSRLRHAARTLGGYKAIQGFLDVGWETRQVSDDQIETRDDGSQTH